MRRFLPIILTVLIAFTVTVIPSIPARAAAILDVQDGILHGARNVNVAGTLYDVEFLDGLCADVFGDCDETPSFQFTDLISSTGAAQALLDQVFLDSSAGQFDSHPELTRGCSFIYACFVYIPYHSAIINTENFVYDISEVANFDPGSGSDYRDGHGVDSHTNTFGIIQETWAKFSLASPDPGTSSVPEPGTSSLFLGAGLALVAMRRRHGDV